MKWPTFIFTLVFLSSVKAATVIPSAPEGWIEMASLDPVELSWVKALPDKKLEQVPTLMVQAYARTEKLEQLFKEKQCFEYQDKEWKQLWCLRSEEVFVILSKNEDQDLLEKKKTLHSWILSHD